MPDVRIGVLDLIGAGLLEKHEYFGGEGHIWPRADLFVTFDADFMEWNPEVDARDLAVPLLNLNADKADAGEAGAALDSRPRRFNAAAASLVGARIVEPTAHVGGHAYSPSGFCLGGPLRRFAPSLWAQVCPPTPPAHVSLPPNQTSPQ